MTEPMALDRQVCFALYSASRATTAAYRPFLDELGITYPQYLVLLSLWERDGQAVGALGHSLALDSGTLSPLLKRLETQQLLSRVRSTDDERRVEVYLTPAGASLRERAASIPECVFAATGLNEAEITQLGQLLRTMTDALRSSVTDS